MRFCAGTYIRVCWQACVDSERYFVSADQIKTVPNEQYGKGHFEVEIDSDTPLPRHLCKPIQSAFQLLQTRQRWFFAFEGTPKTDYIQTSKTLYDAITIDVSFQSVLNFGGKGEANTGNYSFFLFGESMKAATDKSIVIHTCSTARTIML